MGLSFWKKSKTVALHNINLELVPHMILQKTFKKLLWNIRIGLIPQNFLSLYMPNYDDLFKVSLFFSPFIPWFIITDVATWLNRFFFVCFVCFCHFEVVSLYTMFYFDIDYSTFSVLSCNWLPVWLSLLCAAWCCDCVKQGRHVFSVESSGELFLGCTVVRLMELFELSANNLSQLWLPHHSSTLSNHSQWYLSS